MSNKLHTLVYFLVLIGLIGLLPNVVEDLSTNTPLDLKSVFLLTFDVAILLYYGYVIYNIKKPTEK